MIALAVNLTNKVSRYRDDSKFKHMVIPDNPSNNITRL
jgi:hypothetical protein